MSKTDKSSNQTNSTGTATPPSKTSEAKKKLTLDVTDVSEVLERKISP
jgi:hypothetical protein